MGSRVAGCLLALSGANAPAFLAPGPSAHFASRCLVSGSPAAPLLLCPPVYRRQAVRGEERNKHDERRVRWYTPRLLHLYEEARMADDRQFEDLLASISQYAIPKMSDSKALLHWFLFNVFRLDEVQSRDAICDGSNDKGIDGVWVDDDTEEIFLFQSVYTNKPANNLGDKDLREFVGSAAWFAHADNILGLLRGVANQELKALVSSYQLAARLEAGYEVKMVFVTTRAGDHNAAEFLSALRQNGQSLDLWDRKRLIGQHQNLARKTRVPGKHRFTLGHPAIKYTAAKHIRACVAPVRALDVATMPGISDRSLFSLNVRLSLGRTRVNKDLEGALKQKQEHPNFLFFHNGITVICRKLTPRRTQVEIEDYSVVNGCQSAVAFFENQPHLTPELLILARFIEVGDDDALAEEITYRSNNQNGINMRDLRSNDRIQLNLKRQFEKEFKGDFQYAIKAGEPVIAGASINNDRAGQLLMALYLDEPYNAHQKYRIFSTDYERVFGRDIDAMKIYLAYTLHKAIEAVTSKIEDPLIEAYQLTNFLLLGLLGGIIKRDTTGAKMMLDPRPFLTRNRVALIDAVSIAAAQMVADFNFYIKEKQTEGYYDYKSEFKSPEKYRLLSSELQRQFDRALVRHPEDSFGQVYATRLETVRT